MAKKPLLLFSGGLDSTYLFLHHIKKGYSVDLLYAECGQSKLKVLAELTAREKIIEWFRGRYDDYLYGVQDLGTAESKVMLAGTPSSSFSQPLPWLIAAMEKVDPKRHSSVQLAYVTGDQIIQHLDDLRDAWNSMWKFTKHGELVPLEFPLAYQSKLHLLTNMPKSLYTLTWVCETPDRADGRMITPCGSCGACIKRKVVEYEYELTHKRSYFKEEDSALLKEMVEKFTLSDKLLDALNKAMDEVKEETACSNN